MATITANLNGGDTITPDADLTFKVYGLIDNYTTAIATVGSANTDANVSVNAGVVTIENVDLSLETFIKVTSIDEAGNESELSDAFSSGGGATIEPPNDKVLLINDKVININGKTITI